MAGEGKELWLWSGSFTACVRTLLWQHFASPGQMDSRHEFACERAHVKGLLSSCVPFLSVKIIFPELVLKGNQHLQLSGSQ